MWRKMSVIFLLFVLTACSSASNNLSKTEEKVTSNKEVITVESQFGDVEIPKAPKRIMAIYLEDYLQALDVTPIMQWYHPAWGIQEHLQLDVPNFDITGSIEPLVEAQPDVIIVDGWADEKIYESFTKIAPTVRIKDEYLDDPKMVLQQVANIVGKADEAEKVIQEYEQRATTLKQELTPFKDETVAVIRVNVGENDLALFGTKNRYIGTIYETFGLTPVALASSMKEYHQILSEEYIPQLEADHIIVFPSNGDWDTKENQEAFKLLEGPLWAHVPAVQKGQVYQANRTYWQSGAILANGMKMDDIEKWFLKK